MAVYTEIQVQREADRTQPNGRSKNALPDFSLLATRVGAVFSAAEAQARDEVGGEPSFRQALIDLAATCEALAVRLPPPEQWRGWLETQEEEIASLPEGARNSRWTAELCIAAVRRFVEHHGRLPVTADWAARGEDHPTTQTMRNRFGSWGAGLRAAGFDPDEQPAEKAADAVAA